MDTTSERARHWNDAYTDRGPDGVSWFQSEPTISLGLLEILGVHPGTAGIDIGGGASVLVDRLVAAGFSDLSVLDLSAVALDAARERLDASAPVEWVEANVLEWRPPRRYDFWHDRAVFHFLTDESDRAAYLAVLHAALEPGGAIVVATFAQDGPEYCSGLPVSRYSVDELAATLGSDFEMVKSLKELHSTPSGAIQPFTWVAGRLRI